MPLVEVRFNLDRFPVVNDLRQVLAQIVPAAFNTPKGPLAPGSITFFATQFDFFDSKTVDVFIAIEAFDTGDRDVDEAAEVIFTALKVFFPDTLFGVWPKLVKAGWQSDHADPVFDGDMSILSAMERAHVAISPSRRYTDTYDLGHGTAGP